MRSFNFFQFSSEWALRLSAVSLQFPLCKLPIFKVINISPGKFPSALQPRFFEVCEQLAAQIVPTLEPFLQELIAVNQRCAQMLKEKIIFNRIQPRSTFNFGFLKVNFHSGSCWWGGDQLRDTEMADTARSAFCVDSHIGRTGESNSSSRYINLFIKTVQCFIVLFR